MQLNRQEAGLFFRLVSERYEHGGIILTSNKYFSDTVIATTPLDKLLYHAITVFLEEVPFYALHQKGFS